MSNATNMLDTNTARLASAEAAIRAAKIARGSIIVLGK